MIKIKTVTANKIVNSKKDFLFYDIDENNKLVNYILTNDFKRKNEFNQFRIVSTIQKELEFTTI
tara:strand:- start:650 stop:841 length:192 start_codon:yes stop_codon:yes gene_type:complete